jgi:hypothetical protein
MPPIRNEKAKKTIEKEGRIEAAISAYKKQQVTSIRDEREGYTVNLQKGNYGKTTFRPPKTMRVIPTVVLR